MKKLSVLLYHKEKPDFLESLQEIGIIHIVENTDIEQPEAASEIYQKANTLSRSCERIVQILRTIRKEKSPGPSRAQTAAVSEEELLHILGAFEAAEKKQETLQQHLSDIRKDIHQLQPWGELDPETIGQIERRGIKLRFFESTAKKFRQLNMDGFFYAIIHSDKTRVRFLVFEKERPFEADGANEVNIPLKSLQILHQEAARLEQERAEIDQVFENLSVHVDALDGFKINNSNMAAFAAADLNMVSELESKVYSLTGWFPAGREKAVHDFLENYLCYYRIDAPAVTDNVPVLLKNNRFSRLFEPITRIYALPSYRELDPTPFFAPFFLVFFGLCLGDLGYGLITVAIALIALWKGPGQYRNLYLIGLLLGGMTIISGIALNSFFGQSIFYLRGNREYFFGTESGAMLSFLGSFVNSRKMTEFPA
ncbi:MAG: V-type ATPase 116kDa subunit family protein, partial [bacterium]